MDAKRRKYLSVGLPGSGLSYRTFFGRPVKKVGLFAIVVGVGFVLLVILTMQNG